MPGEDYQSWSTVAASNGNSDMLIDWHEGQRRDSVNNSARSMLAAHAKDRNLRNGSIVTFGTENVQQFLSGVSYTTVPTGLVVKLRIGAGLTNTASATLNMDSIGDVLIKTADNNPLKGGELIDGAYADLLYDGTSWIFLYSREHFEAEIHGGDGVILGKQIFATSGSALYTPSAGMANCIIECVGGGGGGGGVVGDVGGPNGYWSGGGGGGGYSRKYATAADIGASQTVMVGAGGAGSAWAGVPALPLNGIAGGDTSVGTLCLAHGGGGGKGCSAAAGGGTGPGGAPGTGDVTAAGSPGSGGACTIGAGQIVCDNFGGSSYFGGGATAPSWGGAPAFTNGNAGQNYGGGGSGGLVVANGNGASGGTGAPGVVIITEFAGRGIPGHDGAAGATGPIGPTGPAGSGTGDVLRTGIPVAGQFAQWTDAAHIQGVDLSLPTTGDVKLTLKTAADTGWVMMNDGSIGDATSTATARANADTQALFALLWTNIPDLWCPVSSGRGATAAADFAAHKRLTLPRTLGRALAAAGSGTSLSARVLGSYLGEENHTLTIAELAAHSHTVNDPTHSHIYQQYQALGGSASAGYPGSIDGTGAGLNAGAPSFSNPYAIAGAATGITIASNGSGTTHNNMQPSSFLNVMVKL